MHVLVVSELYAPTQHTEAFCTTRFARALAATGAVVTVVTSGPGYVRETPDDPSRCWRDEGGVTVHRLPTPPRPVRALQTAVARWTRPGRPKWWHVAAARRTLELAATTRFDVVVTRHQPDRLAPIGAALAARGVPWVAVLPDPSPACLHPPPYGPGAPTTAAERDEVARAVAAWRSAAALCVPSARLARHLEAAFERREGPWLVVPHVGGVSDGTAAPAGTAGPGPARAPRADDELTLVHTGLWMKGRVGDGALAALRAAAAHAAGCGRRLRVDLVGPPKDADRARVAAAGLGDVVRFRGAMPHEGALAAAADATACLLLEAPMAEGIYLPSKFCDYARTGRPVLAFSPRAGAVADALGPGHPGLLGQSEAEATAGLVAFVDRCVAAGDGPVASAVAGYAVPDPARWSPEVVGAACRRALEAVVARAPR